MAWSTLPTYVDGDPLTAAMLLAIAANINETAVAKATTAGYHFVANGTNVVVERAIVSDKILTQQTTTSTTYVNLATVGATVTVTTGTHAIISHGCQMFSSGTGSCWSSYALTGATTSAADDERAITCEAAASNSFRMGYTELQTLTAGSNVVTQKYRVGSLTGTFDDRHVAVMAL